MGRHFSVWRQCKRWIHAHVAHAVDLTRSFRVHTQFPLRTFNIMHVKVDLCHLKEKPNHRNVQDCVLAFTTRAFCTQLVVKDRFVVGRTMIIVELKAEGHECLQQIDTDALAITINHVFYDPVSNFQPHYHRQPNGLCVRIVVWHAISAKGWNAKARSNSTKKHT